MGRDILSATERYEAWISKQTHLVAAGLDRKHKLMASSLFVFLRATFYRWIQIFPETCPELMSAPSVVAIGDNHLENFGTWRDREGRLIWGINDFDEAFPLPYTNDLVRLAASIALAAREHDLRPGIGDACDVLLDGYREGLRTGGRPFVLDEEHTSLRVMALERLRDPATFWQGIRGLQVLKAGKAREVRNVIASLFPELDVPFQVMTRQAGVGSLGRPRYVALTESNGGPVAREIKAVVKSAAELVLRSRDRSSLSLLVRHRNLLSDAFLRIGQKSIGRRLAPDCAKIELDNLLKRRDEDRLINAMGFETANVHGMDKRMIKTIHRDLASRPARWLQHAVEVTIRTLDRDHRDWRKAQTS